MTYFLTYQIKGIDGQTFVMPIRQEDTVKSVSSLVKKEFGIIPPLSARIYGSELQSTNILSQCVRSQDIVTFDCKKNEKGKPELEFYRKPLIYPRYQSKTTFIVFTTINFKSMINGNKIKVNVDSDNISIITKKIKDMLKSNYKSLVNDSRLKNMKILLFLPGGVPFLDGTIGNFIESFPEFMPHLYAVIYCDKSITDDVLDETFDSICDLRSAKIKSLISPDYTSETDGLCEIAAVLGYIQHNGQNIKRMIYSIAKYCPFAPMINGLYNLSCLSRVTGRTILQIMGPLIQLFISMSSSFDDQSNLLSYTVKFLTYFMNIKISDRVPCTEFIRPFYSIGFEKYFHDIFPEKGKFEKIQSIIAFDPDFRDQDFIRFELPSLTEEDFNNAMLHTKTLDIIPALSLREMHRVSLFRGSNGPWLFLAASVSKEETEKDKIDYINPEKGIVEKDTYENIAKLATSNKKPKVSEVYDGDIDDLIDPEKVTQLVVIVIDKSGSMRSTYAGSGQTRFQASQKFFVKFTEACYRFHTTSLYGSIMFNTSFEIRNKLNPLVEDFKKKMIIEGERPTGGTRMFTAMKRAADLLLDANCIDKTTGKRKYPNAEMREIVISDGYDGCGSNEMTTVSNFLLSNHIRIDGIIVSNEVAKELVAISRYSGGISFFPRTVEEGLELFNKEEFFNVNLRQFGPFHAPNIKESDIKGLKQITVDDLDKGIKIKPNEFADNNKLVTSPQYAVSEYEKAVHEQIEKGTEVHLVHRNQKRIIYELKKVMSNPDEDIKIFPLKDRVDIWRVLIRAIDGNDLSKYEGKWFFMIIEFTGDYPQHYPLFRFVYPPFHPNITDQGRICLDTLDKNYRSDMSILELLQEVKVLLMDPNYDSCVDLARQKLKGNVAEIQKKVKEWNKRNGKDSPEDWEKEWKIQPDGKLFDVGGSRVCIVPEEYLCPITRKIMREPVKATSGVYYEKASLENYIKTTPNPTCKARVGKDGKEIPLPVNNNTNLKVDNEMKTKIAKWIKDNDYREDEDEDDEDENIVFFRKGKKQIKEAHIEKLFKDGSVPKSPPQQQSSSRMQPRPRPPLAD